MQPKATGLELFRGKPVPVRYFATGPYLEVATKVRLAHEDGGFTEVSHEFVRVGDKDVSQLPGNLATALQVAPGSDGILNVLRQYQTPTQKTKYLKAVEDFIKDLRPLIKLLDLLEDTKPQVGYTY